MMILTWLPIFNSLPPALQEMEVREVRIPQNFSWNSSFFIEPVDWISILEKKFENSWKEVEKSSPPLPSSVDQLDGILGLSPSSPRLTLEFHLSVEDSKLSSQTEWWNSNFHSGFPNFAIWNSKILRMKSGIHHQAWRKWSTRLLLSSSPESSSRRVEGKSGRAAEILQQVSRSSSEETSLRTHRLQNFFRRPALLQRIQILEFGICDFFKNLWRISCLQPSCSSARRSLRVRTPPVFEISAQQRPNSRAGESCLKKFLQFFIGSNTLLRTLANYLDFGFWDPASANWRNWAGPMESHTDSKPMSIDWLLCRLLTLKEINYFWKLTEIYFSK